MPIYSVILKELKRRGHQITLLTSFPHYRFGRPETWPEYRKKLYQSTSWEGIKLLRTYVFAPVFKKKRFAIFFRALTFLSFSFSSFISAVILTKQIDIVLAPSSPPLFNGLVASVIARLKGCPIVYNVQDIYPDMAVKSGIIKNGILIGILDRVEKFVLMLSTKVVTLSKEMAIKISGKGVPSKKIELIENFIDASFITPLPKTNEFSKNHNISEKFVVMYAGNIGIPHGVEVLVFAAKKLEILNDISFCFVVRGENVDLVKSIAKENNTVNTLFLPPQDEAIVPFIWASASVCCITYRKGLAGDSVPSKLLAMMCAGKPIIASIDSESEAARIIRDAECGLIVEPGNFDEIADKILILKNNKSLAADMGNSGRVYVENHFDKETIVNRFENLFLSVVR